MLGSGDVLNVVVLSGEKGAYLAADVRVKMGESTGAVAISRDGGSVNVVHCDVLV